MPAVRLSKLLLACNKHTPEWFGSLFFATLLHVWESAGRGSKQLSVYDSTLQMIVLNVTEF
jgi:hypothetical protein